MQSDRFPIPTSFPQVTGPRLAFNLPEFFALPHGICGFRRTEISQKTRRVYNAWLLLEPSRFYVGWHLQSVSKMASKQTADVVLNSVNMTPEASNSYVGM
jgi:hypothetical protein